MTLGWAEGLVILVIVIIVVGLAFRTGVSRGRRR
jgi:hypothetical protein